MHIHSTKLYINCKNIYNLAKLLQTSYPQLEHNYCARARAL